MSLYQTHVQCQQQSQDSNSSQLQIPNPVSPTASTVINSEVGQNSKYQENRGNLKNLSSPLKKKLGKKKKRKEKTNKKAMKSSLCFKMSHILSWF